MAVDTPTTLKTTLSRWTKPLKFRFVIVSTFSLLVVDISSFYKFVTPSDSRDKVISRFRAVAKECAIQAVIFAHPLNPGLFDEKLLGVFVPHLRLVAGMGAGFDHGM